MRAATQLPSVLIRGVLLAALALLSATPSSADPNVTAAEVDNAVIEWRKTQNIASAAVAVTYRDDLVGSFGHGGWKPDVRHPAASLSKAITAVCIAKLIDANQISFGDTMEKLLSPSFTTLGRPADPRFNKITVGQLLTHRAGIEKNTFGDAHDTTTAVKNTLATKLRSDPGKTFYYSDSGYLLIGYVIETVTKKPYLEACNPTLTAEGAKGNLDNSMPERAPNGGWDISAIDYAMFLKAMGKTSSAFSPHMQKFLWSPHGKPRYSLGAFVKKNENGDVLTHTGLVHHDATHKKTGGSYYRVGSDGYTVVVIFSGENGGGVYTALEKAVEDTLHAATGAQPAQSSDKAPASSAPPATAAGAPTFTAVIDGQPWTATSVDSTYTTIGGRPVFNLSARSAGKTTSFFSFNLFEGPGKTLSGSIPLIDGKPTQASNGAYNADALGGDALANGYVFDSGAVVIAANDKAKKQIAGDYSGTAHNHAGKTIHITKMHFAGVAFDPAQSK